MFCKHQSKNVISWTGMVAHTCNPSTLGGQGRWITWGQVFKTAWPTWWNPVSTKNTEISWVWWHVPVVPTTQEAEAGELLEPRRQRLQWAQTTPLHSSLGNKNETLSQNKNKNKKQKTKTVPMTTITSIGTANQVPGCRGHGAGIQCMYRDNISVSSVICYTVKGW